MAADRAERLGAGELGEETGRSGAPLKARLFFGLPLPEPQRRALDEYLRGCAALAPEFRWTPPENLHLTIRFMGQVEEALADGVASRLEEAAPPAFELALGDVGTFNRGRLARVVWMGAAAGEPEAAALAELVESACVGAGLESEDRRFRAHLTLARARPRDGAPLPELPPAPALSAWRAGELILYRSRLTRGGSVYEPRRTIVLS